MSDPVQDDGSDHRSPVEERFRQRIACPSDLSSERLADFAGEHVLVVGGNTSERERTEEAIRQSEFKFRSVAEYTYDWEYWLDENGRFLYCSPSCQRITGHSADEFLADAGLLEAIVHPEDRVAMATHLHGQESGHQPTTITFRVLTIDGQTRWVEHICQPVVDSEGYFRGRRASNRDITDRRRAEELREQSEERLRLALSAGRLATWDRHLPTDEVTWNDEHFRMMGYEPDEVKPSYQAWAERVHPEDRPSVEAKFQRSLEQGGDYAVEFRSLWPNGTVRWVEARGRVERDAAGQPIRSYGVMLDTTDRKQMEERTARQNAVLSGIARIFHQALTCQTEEELGRVCLAVAEEVTQSRFGFVGEINHQTGKLDDIAISDPGWELCKMQDPSGHGKRVPIGFVIHGIYGRVLLDGKALFTNDPPSHPDSIGTPAGHPPLKAFLGVPLIHAGQTIGMMAVGNREGGYGPEQLEAVEALAPAVVQAFLSKRAEEAIRHSESRYRELVQNANSAIIRWRCDGTITFFNEYAQTFFGYTADEVIGRHVDILVPQRESSGADLTGLVRSIVDHPERYVNNINENVCRDGRRVWMTWTNQALRDERGRVTEFLAIGSDITARICAEGQLKMMAETLEQRVAERTAEVQWRTKQLQQLAAQMTEVEERERRRLAQVLHDNLQQLLVAVKIKIGLTGRGILDEHVHARIAEALSLVDEAITESRSLTKELSPPILYDGGLAAALGWLGRETESRHNLPVCVELAPETEPDDLTTKVFVFQAVRELILNAVKHGHASSLKICLSRIGEDQLQLVVEDDGTGFEPEAVRGMAGGGGFGLFSIRERLDVIGGRLDITSAPGQGTKATIFVPCGRTGQGSVLSGEMTRRLLPTLHSSSNQIRVLLVDDHPMLRKGLGDLISAHPDLSLIGEAQDGQEALEIVLQLRPDVVLMDITMPRMDGIEATRRIKQAAPEVCVIGLSMHETEEMAAAMSGAGASDYLTKTAPMEDLIAAILRVCPRR